jgi:hypothetical protein
LNNVLSRRRAPVIVRRADAGRPARPDRRRRGSRRFEPPTRASVIASLVLLLATVAWLFTFAYLVIVVH